jgi:hypothetical protein
MQRAIARKRTNCIFSFDSPKAIKANKYGYLNAIHYMAPSDTAGVGNLCSHASPGCIALCLGLWSGQASMVKDATSIAAQGNGVRASRVAKARRFMRDRANYMLDFVRAIDNAIIRARKKRRKLCVRPNGSTDVAYEGIHFRIERDAKGKAVKVLLGGMQCKNIFDHYPRIQFVDYTKNPRRLNRKLPANYSLTLSRSETNEAECLEALRNGHNVAVVFHGEKPAMWNGYHVIDGDLHDLRHLDPAGVVVGLSPKGNKAKRDRSGFVLRQPGGPRRQPNRTS